VIAEGAKVPFCHIGQSVSPLYGQLNILLDRDYAGKKCLNFANDREMIVFGIALVVRKEYQSLSSP
tara:strand:- start:692 stop:889 length:198 start_codon:yes stop_codon:yes gene_type:complete